MKKLLLTIFVLLFIQLNSYALDSAIKFIQVTDVHFQAGNEFCVNTLTNTVTDINKQKGISFVIFTGDNIDRANAKDLIAFIKIANKLHRPYYLVLGNHDVFKSQDLSKEQYNEVVRAHKFWPYRKWNYSFRKNGYTFIVLDGAKEVIPGPAGYFRQDTLTWFDKELKKNENHPVIIFQHYPIIESPDFGRGRIKTHKTYKVEDYYEVLNKHDNVLAIISGHYHVNSESMKDGIYHINTPTLMAEPHYYKIIDIVTQKGLSPIIYTQLKEVE